MQSSGGCQAYEAAGLKMVGKQISFVCIQTNKQKASLDVLIFFFFLSYATEQNKKQQCVRPLIQNVKTDGEFENIITQC